MGRPRKSLAEPRTCKTEKQYDPAAAPCGLAAGLTPAELTALKKVGAQADKLRDRLKAGLAAVDFVVRVKGALSVGEDQPGGTIVELPDASIVLAIVLARLKASARAELVELLRAEFQKWIAGGDEPAISEQQEAAADDVLRHVSRQVTARGKRGNVTGAIGCELVERRD